MEFWEVLGLFLCFCVCWFATQVAFLLVQGRIMKAQQTERVDALLSSGIRALMKFRLELLNVSREKGGDYER